MCSTPFGITEYISALVCSVVCTTMMCSTPFGITEYIRWRPACTGRALPPVLNALRHHGIYQRRAASPISATRCCAQRPSASRNISEDGAVRLPREPVRVCSTPFGITEYISHVLQVGARRELHVLNALRHHGIYQMTAHEASSWAAFSAQRPSASRNISADSSGL